jgi:hypothetical protein
MRLSEAICAKVEQRSPNHRHTGYTPVDAFTTGWVTLENGECAEIFDVRELRDALSTYNWEYFEGLIVRAIREDSLYEVKINYLLHLNTSTHNTPCTCTTNIYTKDSPLPALWDYGVTTTNNYYCVYYDYIVDLFAQGKMQYINPSAVKKSTAKHAIVLRDDWDDVRKYVVCKYDTLAGDDDDNSDDDDNNDDDDDDDGDSGNGDDGDNDGGEAEVAQAPHA